MNFNRFSKFVFMLTVALAFACLPVMTAQAAPAQAESIPVIDWADVVNKLMVAVIPILAAALTAQGVMIYKYFGFKLQIERPDIMELIQKAAVFAVPVIEQLKKSGVIPDNETAKREAIDLARRVLAQWGMSDELAGQYLSLIVAAIEGEVGKMNANKLTITSEILSEPAQV